MNRDAGRPLDSAQRGLALAPLLVAHFGGGPLRPHSARRVPTLVAEAPSETLAYVALVALTTSSSVSLMVRLKWNSVDERIGSIPIRRRPGEEPSKP